MASTDKSVEVLESIADRMNDKFEETIHIISKNSDINQKFFKPLQLDPKRNYKVALKYFSVYNNIQNITEENNELRVYASGRWLPPLKLTPGAYEVKSISETIKKELGGKDYVELVADIPTQRVVLKLKDNVRVDFSHPKSFNNLLGFEPKEYTLPYNLAENIANIDLGRNIINIKSDLISGGYISTEYGLQAKNILFSIPTFTVPSGHKIIEVPSKPEYLPVIKHMLMGIRLEVVDEHDQPYDFKGDKIIIKLHIKQV